VTCVGQPRELVQNDDHWTICRHCSSDEIQENIQSLFLKTSQNPLNVLQVSLPKAKVEHANPENVTDRILKRTSAFEAKTQHYINQPAAYKLHRNLAAEIQQTCDFLLIQLQRNAKIMNGSTTGALMHILSVMQVRSRTCSA